MALEVPQGVGILHVPRWCAGEASSTVNGSPESIPHRGSVYLRGHVPLRHQTPVSDRLDNSWFHPHHVAPIGEENNAPGSKLRFSGVLHFRGAGRRRRAPSARDGREGE